MHAAKQVFLDRQYAHAQVINQKGADNKPENSGSGVVCRLPREFGACANSVYQALFPPPPHKSLGTRLGTVKPHGNKKGYLSCFCMHFGCPALCSWDKHWIAK